MRVDGAALQFGGAGRPVADHDLAGCPSRTSGRPGTSSLVPCRMPSWLAPVWLDQSVRQGVSRWVASSQPATVGIGGRCPRRPRPQHVVADAVELEEHRAGRSRGARPPVARRGAAAVGEPVEPAPVGVVVPYRQGGAGRRGAADITAATTTAVSGRRLAAPGRDQPQGDQQQRAVEEEDQQAEYKRGHQQQGPYEQGPHQRR